MKYELAIFDLDGTILDTLDDLNDSINYALAFHHLPARTREETRKNVGGGIRKLVVKSVGENGDEEMMDKVEETFKPYYGQHCKDKTKPYDGIIELVNEIKARGMKAAVVSNKGDYAVQILVKDYFGDVFDFALGERADIKRKPAPDMVYECLRVLGVDKKKAVYIGDSEPDIQTAVNSHMDCISVDYGFRSKETLIAAGATVICESVEELKAELLKD